MIDAQNFTNFYATDHELQEMFLFAVSVAGKPSKITQFKVNLLVDRIGEWQKEDHPDAQALGPLEYLIWLEHEAFLELIQGVKLGKYQTWLKLWRFFNAQPNTISTFLRTASISDLEKIPGVKFKTSRFFVLHSRMKAECVPLDTHILRFLRDRGVPSVPNVTPASKNIYDGLEKIAIEALKTLGYSTLAKADLETWKAYSNNFSEFFRGAQA